MTVPAPDAPRRHIGGRHLTTFSLLALGLGLGLGLLVHGSAWPPVQTAGEFLAAAGRVWLAALQFTVVPLVLTQAMLAVLTTEHLGVLGARTLLLFALMLAAGALVALLVSPPLIALYQPDPGTVQALKSGVSVPESLREALREGTAAGDWVRGWLPTSVGRLFRGGNLLFVIVTAMLLGVAGRALPGARRERLRAALRRLGDLTLRVLGLVLFFTPVGVLALSFGFARGAGGGALGFLTVYVVLICIVLLIGTALLYGFAVLVGRVPLRRFLRAMGPPTVVGLSTRSSLASLPAMIESGRAHLALPAAGTGFVLPLAVATFKQNMALSHTFSLLFLGQVFGVPLSAATIAVFVVTVALISFSAPGIPGGNPGVGTLPAFVAAGIPVEGVVILDAVEAVPDIFKTLINVTADMSAALVLTARGAAAAETTEPAAGAVDA